MLVFQVMAARKSQDFSQIAHRVVAQATTEKPVLAQASTKKKPSKAKKKKARVLKKVPKGWKLVAN